MAAYAAGVTTVLIPEDNLRNLEDLDPLVREHLRLIPCRTVCDVLSYALLPAEDTVTDRDTVRVSREEPDYPDLIPTAHGSRPLPLGR